MSVDTPVGLERYSVPAQHPAFRHPLHNRRRGDLPVPFEPPLGQTPVTAEDVVGSSVLSDSFPAAGAAAWGPVYAKRLALTDTAVVVLAALLGHVPLFSGLLPASPVTAVAVAVTAAVVVVWLVAMGLVGSRAISIVGHGPEEYRRVVHATAGSAAFVALIGAMIGHLPPPSLLWLTMPLGLGLLLAGRFVQRRWLHRRRREGQLVSRVLVVGTAETARSLVEELDRAPLSSYRVAGLCLDRASDAARIPSLRGIPILGDLDQVARTATEHEMDVVAVTSTAQFGAERVRGLGWSLENTAVDLVLAPALTNVAGPRIRTTPVAGLPLLHVERPTYRGANRIWKRVFDLVVGGVVVLLASPVLIGLALAVKLSDHGPVFFRQERVGLNGEIFRMIKFRSMVVDAEAKLQELADSRRDAGNDVMFKMKHDPRVTRIGRILRRLSLDELPQLLNVIKGDMSLVGPRPPLQSEVDLYGADARLRLLVKPGMTGLWQVSGRSNLSWEDSVRLDTYYVENWSITSDVVILFKTAKAVLSSSGAF